MPEPNAILHYDGVSMRSAGAGIFRLETHAVRFRDRADDTAGIPRGEREGGNAPRDHASRADDTSVPDRDARTDYDVCAEPAVVPITTGFA